MICCNSPSGSQPAGYSDHHLTIIGEIFAPHLRCCHRPDKTDGNQAVSDHCSPVSILTPLPMLHASADASQHPNITSHHHHHHRTSHTPQGSAQTCEFKQSYFPRQVAGKWHYLQKILDHEEKDMMMREYSKTPRKFQKGRHGPSKGNMAVRMEQSPPTLRLDEAPPLTDSTSPKEEEI